MASDRHSKRSRTFQEGISINHVKGVYTSSLFRQPASQQLISGDVCEFCKRRKQKR